MRSSLRGAAGLMLALALLLATSAPSRAADRGIDPEGDVLTPRLDIVMVTTAVDERDLVVKVELAGRWSTDLNAMTVSYSNDSGMCWGYSMQYVAYLEHEEAYLSSEADGWEPERRKPISASVEGSIVTLEVPRAWLGDPDILYFMVHTFERGGMATHPYDVFPDDPAFPGEWSICRSLAIAPDDPAASPPAAVVLPVTFITAASGILLYDWLVVGPRWRRAERALRTDEGAWKPAG